MTGQPRPGELRAMPPRLILHHPQTSVQELETKEKRAVRILGVDVLIRIFHGLQKANAAQRIASVLNRFSDGCARFLSVTDSLPRRPLHHASWSMPACGGLRNAV